MSTVVFRFCIFCIFFFISTLNAAVYDHDTLNIFAKITPRFIFLSSVHKSIKKEIRICIFSDEMESKAVDSFTKNLHSQYPNGIKNYPLEVITLLYSDLDEKSIQKCHDAQIMFLFNSSTKSIQKAVLYAKEHQILTISYDEKLLQNNVDISLFIGRKTVPYINLESIKNKGISLNNTLLRISKIYK